MKKIIFKLGALCITAMVFAQTTFGIKAGPDFSSIKTKTGNSKITSSGLIGVEAGVYANLSVAPELFVQASLMYAGKGGKYNLGEGYMQTQRFNYIMLPVDLLFKPEMPRGNGSWYIGAGPYIAYGISGKISDGFPGSSPYDPFKNYGGGSSLKRFDAGAHVQVGYELSDGFNIGLNAAWGLMNLVSHSNSARSARNMAFGITLGYTLRKSSL